MIVKNKIKEILARNERQGKEITQLSQLANKIDMGVGQLSDIARNRYDDVKLSTAYKISTALDLPIEEVWVFIEE